MYLSKLRTIFWSVSLSLFSLSLSLSLARVLFSIISILYESTRFLSCPSYIASHYIEIYKTSWTYNSFFAIIYIIVKFRWRNFPVDTYFVRQGSIKFNLIQFNSFKWQSIQRHTRRCRFAAPSGQCVRIHRRSSTSFTSSSARRRWSCWNRLHSGSSLNQFQLYLNSINNLDWLHL